MTTVSARFLTVLFNALWQIALVTGASALCARLLKNSTAGVRHMVWVCALAAPLVLAGIALWPAPHRAATPIVTAGAAITPDAQNFAVPTTENFLLLPVAPPALPSAPKSLSVTREFAAILVAAYFLLIAYRSFRLTQAWLRTRAIVRSGREVELGGKLRAILAKCENALGARAEIRASAEIASPLTAGSLRPLILLPEQMFQEPDEDLLTSALGHELAHVRHHDYAFNFLYELMYAPFSFHPGAAWVLRRIRQTRELRCDELVAGKLVRVSAYAQSLVKMAQWSPVAPYSTPTISLGIADAGNLEERIMSLLRKSHAGTHRRLITIVAALTLFVLPCIAMATHVFPVAVTAPDRAAAQSQVYKAGSDGVSMPKVVSAPSPPYAQDARKNQIQGVVLLEATVDANGLVTEVRLVKSLYPSLDESAMTTVRTWRFAPAMKDGNAVATRLPIEATFTLPDAEVYVKVGQGSTGRDVVLRVKTATDADGQGDSDWKIKVRTQLDDEQQAAKEKAEQDAQVDSDRAKLRAEQQAGLNAVQEKLAQARENGASQDELRTLESQLDLMKLQAKRSEIIQRDVADRAAELQAKLAHAEEALREAQDQHEATDDVQKLMTQLGALQAQLQYMQKYQRGVAIKDEDGTEVATLENSKLWSKFEQGSSQQQLAKITKIPMSKAIETASAQQPGSVVNCQLLGDPGAVTSQQNPEPGAIYYAVSIVSQNGDTTTRRTIFVDALTGKIFERK